MEQLVDHVLQLKGDETKDITGYGEISRNEGDVLTYRARGHKVVRDTAALARIRKFDIRTEVLIVGLQGGDSAF